MRDSTVLVTVMHSNNEVGSVQDIAAIAEKAHARGALVHTDAAQSLGEFGLTWLAEWRAVHIEDTHDNSLLQAKSLWTWRHWAPI